MDPVCEELCDFLAFPLGCHVPCSVNSCEVKTIVTDEVARDLAISVPWSPVLLNRPVKFLNPSASSIGRDSTISISRVMENLVAILLQDLIDPERAFILISIALVDIIITLDPSLYRIGNVKSTSDILSIIVIRHIVAKKWVR